jgi:hypothetical protein
MGVAFVFVIYLVLIGCFALPGMAVGGWIGSRLSRGAAPEVRRRALRWGALLPLLGAAYLICFIVAMAAFGVTTHRDFGFGDGFLVPLHHGYELEAIDVPDSAFIYSRDGGSVNLSRFSNVLSLQQEGDWLAGAYGTHDSSFNATGDRKQVADRWFLFNTRTTEQVDAASEDALRKVAKSRGVKLALVSSEQFYDSQRFRWYDFLVGLLLWVPAAIAALYLYKAVRRMRREIASSGSSYASNES